MLMKIIKCKECKENKPHAAKGLCLNCYTKQYKKPLIICSSCKKLKPHHAKKLCSTCYKRQNLIICSSCNQLKPHQGKGLCVTCYQHKNGLHQPMHLNKSCSSYLGVTIAEQVLSKVFKDVQKMPYGHKGYDFICSKGYKIDVKSGCLTFNKKTKISKGQWYFSINKNTTPDYFLIIAFDSRESLTPQHLWLIPAEKISHLKNISISPKNYLKYSEYELSLKKTLECCNKLK